MRTKTVICATALILPIGVAGAQDVQDAISDSVADRLSPGNGTVPATENGLGNSIGDAVRSGIGTAGNQVLQGNSDTNANSTSMNESASEEAIVPNEEAETNRNASANASAEANEAAQACYTFALNVPSSIGQPRPPCSIHRRCRGLAPFARPE